MSTAPSGSSAGAPVAAKRSAWPPPAWLAHDLVVYASAYLVLLLADTPAGGGWDALIAAAPVAASQLLRQIASRL